MNRLLAFRRPPRRQRFRDRMLVGMLVVALVPLVVFTVIVALDLRAVSHSTVEGTHQSILEHQEERLQGVVDTQASTIDAGLREIASEVQQLRSITKGTKPSADAASISFLTESGAYFASTVDTSVIVGQTSHLVHNGTLDTAGHSAAIAAPSGTLVPFMEAARKNYPEIEAMWIVDKQDLVIRTVPGIDVRQAIRDHRIDPDAPLGADGELVFSTSQERFAETANQPQAWNDPAKPDATSVGNAGPYWTDPYRTRQGDQGITVWMPVDDRTLVGADIAVTQLTGPLVDPEISGEPGAYPILLSSNNRVLAAGQQAQSDFHLPANLTGAPLPLDLGSDFATDLLAVEQTGHSQKLRATVGGVERELFTTPVYTAHWVLATSVPVRDLEPDVTGLTRGIESGIQRILLHVIPVALVLCALAVLLANLVARRLVGPVRALQVSAERLAEGRTDEPVPPQGTDEVGMLAASLERMRREINASRDAILAAARELEGRVADRTKELRTRNEELVALNALAGALTRALGSEAVLAGAVDTARAVLPAVAAAGFVTVDGELRRLVDWADSPDEESADVDEATLLRPAEGAVEARGVVVLDVEWAAPVLVGLCFETSEGVLGALAVACRPGTAVAERTCTLLEAVSDQVGLALRTVQLAAEGRELAVLEERTRLAREIHDTLAQQLTAIVLQLEAAEAYVRRDTGRTASLVITARDLARSALQEARRSVWNLRPAPLEATGLIAAVDREVRRWQEQTGIAARLRADRLPHPLALQPSAEVALFRIVQEALTNVARHSGARHAEVVLSRRDQSLELTVSDDGSGFDVAAEPHAGSFGLVGMGERARLAGGSLEVVSAPGEGTRVVARLPLGEAASSVVAASA